MARYKLPLTDWTWYQIGLILGPILVSLVLVAFYLAGILPVDWPGLLIIVVLVNLAGDIAYAVKDEYMVNRRRVSLRNDMIDSRAEAVEDFTLDGHAFGGTVTLSGERWRAVSERRVEAGSPVRVVGRHGLVLEVVETG